MRLSFRVWARHRLVWPLLGSVAFVGFLFLAVFPTRTYLAQRASMQAAERQLDVLGQENDRLARQIEALNTDQEIERLAREKYNLVKPGEEAYAIFPAPPPSIELPRTWPFRELAEKLDRPDG